MSIAWVKHLCPEARLLSFDQIARLCTIEVGLVSHFNQFFVALTPSSLVGSEGQVRVAVFAILANNLTVVELVFDEKFLGIFKACVDVDLGQGIVQRRLL